MSPTGVEPPCLIISLMVHAFLLHLDIANKVSKALPGCELGNSHCEKLAPTIKGAELLTTMMFMSKFFKIISREKRSNLVEYRGRMCHGSDLLVFKCLLAISF